MDTLASSRYGRLALEQSLTELESRPLPLFALASRN